MNPAVQAAWFQPSEIRLVSFTVAPEEQWTFLELISGNGNYGIADISCPNERNVIPLAANFASQLQGSRIFPEDNVPAKFAHLASGDDREAAAAVSGVASAVSCALARAAEMPLANYLASPSQLSAGNTAPPAIAVATGEALFEQIANLTDCGSVLLEVPGSSLHSGAPLKFLADVKGKPVSVRCVTDLSLDTALKVVEQLAEIGVERLEEPINIVTRSEDLRVLCESAQIKVGAGWRMFGLESFKERLWQRCADFLIPDIRFCGGAEEAVKILKEITRSGADDIGCRLTGQITPVSTAISRHILMAAEVAQPLEKSLSERYEWVDDIFVRSDDEFGIGLAFNPEVVAEHGKLWTL